MIRLGIGLYGVDSSGTSKLNLQTVATLKSTIAQVKHLKKGESVVITGKELWKKIPLLLLSGSVMPMVIREDWEMVLERFG